MRDGLKKLVEAGMGKPDTVLVCGVGGGADLEYWLEHLPMNCCVAIDFAIEAIKATQRRVSNHGLPVITRYVTADIECIPLQDQSVDVVIASQVLHHTLEPAQACKEMFRVARRAVLLLEPAQTKVVSLFKRLGIATSVETVGNVVLRFRKSDFDYYLSDSKCSIQYSTYLFYDPPLVEKILTAGFQFPGGLSLLKAIYWAADRVVLPLHSKCAVLVIKRGSYAG